MSGSIAKAVEAAEWYCGTANLGYDQYNRWDFPELGDATTPGECDCSSLVAKCLNLAGFDVPINGDFYTGNERRLLEAAGFEYVAYTGTDWPFGAVLFKSGHTAIWTGKYIAEAYGDERGAAHGGASGDQGNETRLSPRRGGWSGYFRAPSEAPVVEWPRKVEPMGEATDYIIEEGGRIAAHETDQRLYTARWQKWASGRLTVQGSDYFAGGTGAKFEGQYYLSKVLEMPHIDDPEAPAFAEPPVLIIQPRAASGWVGVQVTSISADKASFWVYGTRRAIPRFSVDFIADGFWQ